MWNLRRTAIWVVLLAPCIGFTAVARGACNGPEAMVNQLRAHPGADNAVLLGSWYASNHQFACAEQTFRVGLEADPNSAQLHYLDGLALIAQEDTAAAFPEVSEAVRLEPGLIKPRLVLASLLDQTGKHAEAEDEWRRALAIDPTSMPALEGLSDNLLASENWPAVIVLLRKAPRTERLAINLSQALGKLNYLEDAAKVLTEALQQSPQSLDLAKAMTVVLVNMHRYEDAIKLVQTTSDQHPDNIDEQVELFRILVLTNHFDRARPLALKLLPLRPHDSEVLYLCGTVARAMGEDDKAKDLLEQAVAIDPNFFYSRYNLGIVLVILRDWKGAKENLEKAIELNVPLPEVHYELARALRGLGEDQRAAEEMKLFQDLKEADEQALEAASASAQGDQDMKNGNIDEASKHYRQASGQQPNNADYRYKLSIALRKAGDLAGERTQLEDAVRLDPRLAGAQNRLGFLLSRSGDASGAVEHFRLAVQGAPAWTEAWINLAAELAVGAHFTEAREAVAKALILDPANTQARELSDRLAHDPAAAQAQP